MIIRIPPHQIKPLWEAIKYAVTMVDRVSENDRPIYLNKVLGDLLSSKAQCFIRLNESRELIAISITRITSDMVTGRKILNVSSLYSFHPVPIEEWKEDFEIIKGHARKTGCGKVVAYTNNKRAIEIMEAVGMHESLRRFEMEV